MEAPVLQMWMDGIVEKKIKVPKNLSVCQMPKEERSSLSYYSLS